MKGCKRSESDALRPRVRKGIAFMINVHKLYADLFTEDGFSIDPSDLPGSYDVYLQRYRSLEQIYSSVFPDGMDFYNSQRQKIINQYASLIKKLGLENVIESVRASAAGERAARTGFSVPLFIQKGDINGLIVTREDIDSLEKGECYSRHGLWSPSSLWKEGDIKFRFADCGVSIVKFKEFSYVFRQQGSDLYKVGKSTNCLRRYQQMSCTNPCLQFEFMTSVPEDIIHNRLYYKKLTWRHEWFKMGQEEVGKLKEFCFGYGITASDKN